MFILHKEKHLLLGNFLCIKYAHKCIKIQQKTKEGVKILQKCHQKCRKMKEGEKNSSNFKKIFKKGVDKSKRMLYNRHIKFIPRQNPIVKIVAPGDQVFPKRSVLLNFILNIYLFYYYVYLLSVYLRIFTIG